MLLWPEQPTLNLVFWMLWVGANGSIDVELTDNSVSVEDFDLLMRRGYGESIVRAKELDSIDNAWYDRWLSIVQGHSHQVGWYDFNRITSLKDHTHRIPNINYYFVNY